jgi:hypothetical protein
MTKDKDLYKTRLIAYIDILGFKELIKNKESNLVGVYEAIDQFVTGLRNIKQAQQEKQEPHKGFPKSFSERDSLSPDINVFSDSILISSGVVNLDGSKEDSIEAMKELRLLFYIVQSLQTKLLKMNILVRGIITHGDLVHKKMKNIEMFFGSGFLEAYKKEKLIKAPIIAVDSITCRKVIAKNPKFEKSDSITEELPNIFNWHTQLYLEHHFLFPLYKYPDLGNCEFCINPFGNLDKKDCDKYKEFKKKLEVLLEQSFEGYEKVLWLIKLLEKSNEYWAEMK